MGELTGKVAIVTGASRGIGRAIAEIFAREGARVVICGRKQETLDQVASEIGPSVKPIACHVGRADQIENMVAVTVREFGPVDILVNNAATNISFGPCLEIDEAQFDKMVEINLKSAFRLVQAIAPGMCDSWQRIDHQHRLGRRPSTATAQPPLQHDQSRAHHDDASHTRWSLEQKGSA